MHEAGAIDKGAQGPCINSPFMQPVTLTTIGFYILYMNSKRILSATYNSVLPLQRGIKSD